MVRLGQGAYIGLGLGPHGTDMAAADMDTWMILSEASDNLVFERDRIEFPDLHDEYETAVTLKAGQKRVTGTLTLKATYDGIHDLLRLVTGHDVTATGASDPFSWAFVPVSRTSGSHYVLSNSNVLGIEVYRGDDTDGSANNSVYYQNCAIQQMQFNYQPGQIVEIVLTIIGTDHTIGAKSTPSAYLTDWMIMPTGQASANDFAEFPSGTAFVCHGASLTLNTGLDFRHAITDIESLMFMPTGKFMVTGECDIETADDTFLTRLSDPETSGAGRFASGVFDLLGSTGGNARQLLHTFDEVVLNSPAEARPAGLGPVRTAFSFNVFSSALGTAPIAITVQNGTNAYNLVV